MIFRRLLLRFFKFVFYIALVWFSFAILYLSLPSPVPNDDSITASLQSGQIITRVFRVDTFFLYTDSSPSVQQARSTGKMNFIMQFEHSRDPQSRISNLVFGGGSNPLLENFHDVIYDPVGPRIPYHNFTLRNSDQEKGVWLSPPIELSIPAADMDGIVPPWIATADAAKLYWLVNQDSADMTFRIRRVDSENIVEVWADGFLWSDYPEGGRIPANTTTNGLKPLVSIRLHGADAPPSFEFPPLPASSSPGIMYPVRLALLLFLLPIGAIALLISFPLSGIFHALIEIVVFLLNVATLGVVCAAAYGVYWWIKNERPSLTVSDVREGVDTVLASARARGASAQSPDEVIFDPEAQNEADTPDNTGKEAKS
ncbi:hypothetical protein WG66_015686 [Moniliophthora roreri]|uniref:Uncharacterized protein n=1 Tax=Moniliophthora roreri TaxID=221103 RepID=A0A0W0F1L3_MONRR|nr:hypothetical protein WG66_015686 [Moniliophthora roreri]